jgi:hypothetical protein
VGSCLSLWKVSLCVALHHASSSILILPFMCLAVVLRGQAQLTFNITFGTQAASSALHSNFLSADANNEGRLQTAA